MRRDASRHADWITAVALVALIAMRVDALSLPAGLILMTYLPGRLLARGFALGDEWDARGRFVLHIALSVTLAPIVLYPLWRLTNDATALLAAVGALVTLGASAPAFVRLRPTPPSPSAARPLFESRAACVGLFLLAAYLFLAPLLTYWPVEIRGEPIPALIHDFIKHRAVLFSLEHHALPLGNPFYADEAAGPVYYYHFFYLIPATLRAFAPSVSIEFAFGLHAGLIAATLAAIAYLTVKRLTGRDGPGLLAALLMTFFGGLDVVPVILLRVPMVTLDAWSDVLVRVHSLLTQIVWTPQNIQGLLIALLAAYVLARKGWWRGWWLLAPALGLALLGSSPWVAIGMVVGLVAWIFVELLALRATPRRLLQRLGGAVIAGTLTLALCAPTMMGYAEMSRRHGAGLTMDWPRSTQALLGRLVPAGPLANLLDLSWWLLVEFGPLLILPLMLPRETWRRTWRDAGLRWLLLSSIVGLVAFVTARSNFMYNDFGHKIIMITMATGALLGGCVVDREPLRRRWYNPLGWTLGDAHPRRRPGLRATVFVACLVLAVPVAVYQTPLMAVRRHIPRGSPLRPIASSIVRAAQAESAATRFLRHELLPDAVIQAYWDSARLQLAQVVNRQVGVTLLERDTMVFHPVDVVAHAIALEEVERVLTEAVSAEECHATLRRHKITHVYVGPPELEHWRGLEKLADPRFFECVFREGDLAVYALRPPLSRM